MFSRSRSNWWAVLLCVMTALGNEPLAAHSMYQSAVLLDFRGNTVQAELQLPVDRLSISFRELVDKDHFTAERPKLIEYVLAHVHPVASDGRSFSVRVDSLRMAEVERAPYLVAHLVLTPPAGARPDLFNLNYDVITHEIVTHVVLVSIRSDSDAKIPLRDPFLIGVLRGTRKSILIDRMSVL